MNTAKQEVEALLQRLPDDCTYEDIQYHIYVLETIHHGLEDIEAGRVVSLEEGARQWEKWHSK